MGKCFLRIIASMPSVLRRYISQTKLCWIPKLRTICQRQVPSEFDVLHESPRVPLTGNFILVVHHSHHWVCPPEPSRWTIWPVSFLRPTDLKFFTHRFSATGSHSSSKHSRGSTPNHTLLFTSLSSPPLHRSFPATTLLVRLSLAQVPVFTTMMGHPRLLATWCTRMIFRVTCDF